MKVYIVTINHEDGNHSVWSTREAAYNAARTLVTTDGVYEAWVEEWELDSDWCTGGPDPVR